ncbi:MAG: hypothetical protein RJB60_506, partial [Pseudomonadota bacterium]
MACALLALSGCAALKGPGVSKGPAPAPAALGASNGAASSNTAAGTGQASSAPAFEVVVKGADKQEGWLPLWRRQEKVWVELAPTDF